MKNIPALFLSEDYKRKLAKEAIKKAVETIKHYGPLAGMSDRSIYEFKALSTHIEREINVEPRTEEIVAGSSA